MNKGPYIVPDAAVKGIASGLCLMAFFTLLWAGIAYGGLNGTGYRFLLLFFPVLSLLFIVNAVQLFKAAQFFPKVTSEADIAEEKRAGKWFGIIFGAEGLGIFLGINIVINLGYPDLTVPVIALVVGLHFYPLARVFKRTIDYYLATWSTVIALCSMWFSLHKTMPQNYILAFLGIGIAIATSCYGLYMLTMRRQLQKSEYWKVGKL